MHFLKIPNRIITDLPQIHFQMVTQKYGLHAKADGKHQRR